MNHHRLSELHIWNNLRVDDCIQCGLHKSANTVCLLGDGPVPAKGMIIGDAPGIQEDHNEIPFSGKSGIFLRKSLKEIGIDPRTLYFGYTTACRPPANQDPKAVEIKTCSRLYLEPQLDKVRPQVILLLGNTALQWAKGKKGAITKEEGSTFMRGSSICVPSRSPSAVLRMEDYDRREYLYALAKFKANLFRFKKLLFPEEDKFPFVQNWEPIEDTEYAPVYTDIEANGINPFKEGAKIHCIGACKTADNVMSRGPLDDRDTRKIRWMLKTHPIMSQGGTFEGTWFYWHYGIEPLIWYDTRLGYFVQDENVPYDLKNRAVRMLNVEPWDDAQDFTNPDFDTLLPYNARDNSYGLRLFKEHDVTFFKKNPKVAKLMRYILCPAEEVFIKVICRGVHINVKEGKKRIRQCAEEKDKRRVILNEAAGYEVNPGSAPQMAKLFYDQLRFKCPVFTKGGKKGKPKPSTSEAALIRLKLRYDNPVIDALWEWRGWAKNESTYLLPWTTRGPIVHFNYGFTNTDTGRLNSTAVKDFRGQKKVKVPCPFCVVDNLDPNCRWCGKGSKLHKRKDPPGIINIGLGATAHQCPRDPFIRSLISPRGYAPEFDVVNGKWVEPKKPFICPEEWCILEADLSQIELRLVAHCSGDETMCSIFLRDGDIHYETARELKPTGEIDDETRKKAKAVNFGFVYGMWWKKFILYCLEKFDLKLRPREGKLYREKFFNKYDGLLPWHRRVEAFVTQNGFIDSVFGRRRHLPSALMPYTDDCPDCLKRGHIEKHCFFCGGAGTIEYGEPEEWIRKEAIRQGINSPIQSAGSDLNLFIAGLMQARSYHETIIENYPMTKWDFKIDEKKAFMVASAHDSQIYECRRDYVKELHDGIKYTVANLPIRKYFGFDFRVPIRMDCKAYLDCWKGTKMEIV